MLGGGLAKMFKGDFRSGFGDFARGLSFIAPLIGLPLLLINRFLNSDEKENIISVLTNFISFLIERNMIIEDVKIKKKKSWQQQ